MAKDLKFEELKNKQIEIAVKMKEKGIDHATISEVTGLTQEEVEEL